MAKDTLKLHKRELCGLASIHSNPAIVFAKANSRIDHQGVDLHFNQIYSAYLMSGVDAAAVGLQHQDVKAFTFEAFIARIERIVKITDWDITNTLIYDTIWNDVDEI